MLTGKEKIIPVLAMTVLLIGIVATVYVNALENNTKGPDNFFTINGNKLSFESLSETTQEITIETDEGNKTGLSLEGIITESGISCPSCYRYTFKASDPYQQTVSWNEVKTGILTYSQEYNLRVYFPNIAHTFWVYDLIEIEVNEV